MPFDNVPVLYVGGRGYWGRCPWLEPVAGPGVGQRALASVWGRFHNWTNQRKNQPIQERVVWQFKTLRRSDSVPVEGGTLGPVRFLWFLRRHDEDRVFSAVSLIQIDEPHLLRLLHVHLVTNNKKIKD